MTSFQVRATMGLAVAACFLAGCMVGPKYHAPSAVTPPAQTPAAYKELTPADYQNTEGWKVAQPKDDALRGKWWEIFNDPQLNALEERVNISNQNIAAAAASFFAARALVKEARSQLFPTATTSPAITVQRSPSTSSSGTSGTATGSTSSSMGTFTEYTFPFDATWQPDLFGRIRNTVRSAAYGAQASAADLENTRLVIQADVAVDYFQLRGQDALKQLLDSTVIAYRQSLDLLQYPYNGQQVFGAPYAKGYAEFRQAWRNGSVLRMGFDYEGNNNANSYSPYILTDVSISRPIGAGVLLSEIGQNIFNTNFGNGIARSIEYQGNAPIGAQIVDSQFAYAIKNAQY